MFSINYEYHDLTQCLEKHSNVLCFFFFFFHIYTEKRRISDEPRLFLKKKKKNAHLLLRSKQEFSLRIGHGSIYARFKSTNFLQPRRSRLRPERATRFSEFAEI